MSHPHPFGKGRGGGGGILASEGAEALFFEPTSVKRGEGSGLGGSVQLAANWGGEGKMVAVEE